MCQQSCIKYLKILSLASAIWHPHYCGSVRSTIHISTTKNANAKKSRHILLVLSNFLYTVDQDFLYIQYRIRFTNLERLSCAHGWMPFWLQIQKYWSLSKYIYQITTSKESAKYILRRWGEKCYISLNQLNLRQWLEIFTSTPNPSSRVSS